MINEQNWQPQRWPNFQAREFACSHCGECELNERFLDRLQSLRTRWGRPLTVNSAYRCGDHPIEAKKRGVIGAHAQGCAADIHVEAADAFAFVELAIKIGFTRIGISQREGEPRFIHLDFGSDNLPNPRIWSY